jgi:hypothetical protein
MPRVCKICAYPDQEAVKAAFASDATDRQLAQRFGVSHMAIGRHRRAHIVGPLKAAVAALDKGRAERQRREQQLAAIEQGDPVAIALAAFAMPQQLGKVTQVEQRLTRMADAAEAAGSAAAVAQLAGQQLRSVEVGSRLVGAGGYGAPRAVDQPAGGARFSINIIFSNGRSEEINLVENRADIEQGTDNRHAAPALGREDAETIDGDAPGDD